MNCTTHSTTTRGQYTATVLASVGLCRDHWKLVLGLKHFPPTRPGQFIQVACRQLEHDYTPDHETDWTPGERLGLEGEELRGRLAFLRRPFSLAGRRDSADGVELQIIHRVVGVGTDWLGRLKVGDAVPIIGPLGNGFELPPAGGRAILVGGGVGIPPMIYLAEALAGRKVVAFCGALTRDLLPLTITADAAPASSDRPSPLYNVDEFARQGVPAVISTDDGSYGYKGYTTDALEGYLAANPAVCAPGMMVIYTCGPEVMMKRVAEVAAKRKIDCQVAVERAMACGMGTCQSCVIRVQKPEAPKGEWVYKLACADGPIFRASDLLW